MLGRRSMLWLMAGVSAMRTRASVADTDDLAERLDDQVATGQVPDVHAVLVSRAGQLVLERYFAGADESWGTPLGIVTFGHDTLHDLRSVTKSIVGLVYGIALDRGLVPPPDAPLLAQFPAYPDLAADPRRANLTVLNALNMTLGMEWDEQRPYTDPQNSEIAMETAPDRYRFILDRPFVATPGERWIYSGGAVALLGGLIAKGTGMTLPDFTRQALFAPLGIETFGWAEGSDGIASAASGLRLRPRDLLRIGEMVLAGGEWRGTRIVSRAWLDASFTQVVDANAALGVHYGRLWYLGEAQVPTLPDTHRWMAGYGNGGQRLYLLPDIDLAVVLFFGAYNRRTTAPEHVWREIIVPAL
jgi:CubicO group peptidase (beta-lactamase class C family)